MANGTNPYTAGYEAAYREIYARLNDENHHIGCDGCRPCGVAIEVVEVLMETLASRMSQDDFFQLALILARTNTTAIDKNGYVRIDWWGHFNGALNADGTYGISEGPIE